MTSQRDTGRERLLPRPLIRLIGRDRDVDEIVATLLDPATSLLTLTGPGGVGKTSLARHIAAILERVFEDGGHVVALEHLQDPDLVAPTLADALGIIPAPAQPAVQQLTRYLRDRNLLLILDNMEQVIESSHFLTPLRESCPHLRILVTSREALHLTGERLFTVQPLDVPSPLGHRPLDLPNRETPAVQLFVERARAVRHDFELTSDNRRHVEEICRRTDGLPLAIELAAARLRSYSISTLASIFRNRLTLLAGQSRDTPVRLHTMRNAVQWSYDLCPGLSAGCFAAWLSSLEGSPSMARRSWWGN